MTSPLQQAVSVSGITLMQIHAHLAAAQKLWQTIDPDRQSLIIDYHVEDKHLAHCLRWGEQNAQELVEMANLPTDPFDLSDIASHAMALFEGVASYNVSRVVECLQVGGVELHAMLAPIAERAAWIEHVLYCVCPEGFTDVFQYQVTEALGQRIAQYVLHENEGVFPQDEWIQVTLAELATTFFPVEFQEIAVDVMHAHLPLANVRQIP